MKLWIAIITLTFTACAVDPQATPLVSGEAPPMDLEATPGDEDTTTCTADGQCTMCTDDGCVACDTYYSMEVGVPVTVETQKAIRGTTTVTPTTLIAEAGAVVEVIIQADGSAIALDAAGNKVWHKAGVAIKAAGQWVLTPFGERLIGGLGKVVVRVAACFGPIAWLLFIAELSHAGTEAALGDAAGQIGIRLEECKDKFARIAAGIACLRNQPSTTTCSDAVSACPDAFFGANTMQTCGAEPGMQDLVDALKAAIQMTAVKSGGAGYNAAGLGLLDGAIKDGTIATDPSKVCQMRDQVGNCEIRPAANPFSDPGFGEAKTCWANADRGIWESKYEEARTCCTTQTCRNVIDAMKDC